MVSIFEIRWVCNEELVKCIISTPNAKMESKSKAEEEA